MLIPTTANLKDTTKGFSDAVFANNSNSSISACSLPQATTTDRLTDFVRVAGLRHKAWWGAASLTDGQEFSLPSHEVRAESGQDDLHPAAVQ